MFLRLVLRALPFRPSILGVFILSALLIGCSPLPPLEPRSNSQSISRAEAQQTELGRSLQPLIESHSGLSGIYALPNAYEAFAVRSLLIQAAEKSVDVQYYIWRADSTGLMLLKNILNAADRGVKVRLLLDDNGIDKLDKDLALLNTHPNIEVRLFNPFVLRKPKVLGYVTEFNRLNHRMHNKSLTVDNMATIVGGRNIGDEYFGATDQVLFTDLDVLAFGPVVEDVSNDFDKYWASTLAYPVDKIIKLKANDKLADIDLERAARANPEETRTYLHLLATTDLVKQLLNQSLVVEWVKTEMVSDDPIKAEGKGSGDQLLTYQLQRALGTPTHQVDLISPYFVPTKTGVEGFEHLLQQPNMQVRLLTNSYEATDVAAVHAGYIKRRKALLKAGMEIYELKKQSSSDFLEKKHKKVYQSSGSSLHAKTFIIDNKRVFIGSFNFDPRSANLNTELGFVIHSSALAQQIGNMFNAEIPESSYQLQLSDEGKVIWLERNGDQITQHQTEPGTSLFSRWWVDFMSVLPIEWML